MNVHRDIHHNRQERQLRMIQCSPALPCHLGMCAHLDIRNRDTCGAHSPLARMALSGSQHLLTLISWVSYVALAFVPQEHQYFFALRK